VSADVAAQLAELTAAVKRLEKAAQQPPRVAYKVTECAALLGVSAQQVRELIHSGRLEATDMGGWYLVSAEALDRMLSRTAVSA
jgi:excisionase family DNA binding protein